MGNTKKKQHYVPKAYLRFFLCMPSKKKDGQIKVLFKSENRIITSNINDIAEENHFYTLDSLDDKFYWENYYSQSIEPLLKDTINEINQRTQTLLLQNKTRRIFSPSVLARGILPRGTLARPAPARPAPALPLCAGHR